MNNRQPAYYDSFSDGLRVNGMQTVEQRLQSIRERIDRGRQEKARAEATLEQLDRQRQEVLAELEELGVTEDQLEDEIARLDREIEAALHEAETSLSPNSAQLQGASI